MTDQTSERTPDGLDVAAIRERYRRVQQSPVGFAVAASLLDIPLLLAALDEARREVERWKDQAGEMTETYLAASERRAAAESARDAAEGVVREVRALAEKWEGYAEACRLGMNNSAGETSEPRILWSAAADRLFAALGDYAAPVTIDATEGEA